MKSTMPQEVVENKIYLIRGHKIMLSTHLAGLYGVEVKTLIQAIKRNADRFPDDFMFQLTWEEVQLLRSQFVTLEGVQAVESRSRRTRNCRRSCMTWKRNTTSSSRLCSTPSGN